jgi:putative flippase GtrA
MMETSKRTRQDLGLFLRFGAVGLLNSGFGYAVFALLIWLGAGASIALTTAALAGTAFNFQTSQRLVFRSRGAAARFAGIYTVVLALNWIFLQLLKAGGLPDLEAQAVLTLPIAGISFLSQRYLVFGRAGEAG